MVSSTGLVNFEVGQLAAFFNSEICFTDNNNISVTCVMVAMLWNFPPNNRNIHPVSEDWRSHRVYPLPHSWNTSAASTMQYDRESWQFLHDGFVMFYKCDLESYGCFARGDASRIVHLQYATWWCDITVSMIQLQPYTLHQTWALAPCLKQK